MAKGTYIVKRKRVSGIFYRVARSCGRIASALYDIEVIASGKPKRIAKRFVGKRIRRSVSKALNKLLD